MFLQGNSAGPNDFNPAVYVGARGTNGVENAVQYLVPVSKTFTTFFCRQSAGVVGQTVTFTVRINGANVGTACTLVGTATANSVVSTYDVSAGDLVTVVVSNNTNNTTRYAFWGLR